MRAAPSVPQRLVCDVLILFFVSFFFWLINHSRSDLHVMEYKSPLLTPCLTVTPCPPRAVQLQGVYMHTVDVGVHISVVAVY